MRKSTLTLFSAVLGFAVAACGSEAGEDASSASEAVRQLDPECSDLATKHVAEATYNAHAQTCIIRACDQGWGNRSQTYSSDIPLPEQAADGCESKITSTTVAQYEGEFNLDGTLCAGSCDGITYYENAVGDADFSLQGRDTATLPGSMWVEVSVLHDKNVNYAIITSIGDTICPMHKEQTDAYSSRVWETVWMKLTDRAVANDDTNVRIAVRYANGQAPRTDGRYSIFVKPSTPEWLDPAQECQPAQ